MKVSWREQFRLTIPTFGEHGTMTRDELIALARRIQDAQDRGESCARLLYEFQAEVPFPMVDELFLSDHSPEYIVDFSCGWEPVPAKLSKEEMIVLVTKLTNADGTEAELALMTLTFDSNCRHPAKNELIYYPSQHFGGNPAPSASEIVEKAWSEA